MVKDPRMKVWISVQ